MSKKWIGVDLDGTLAHYTEWKGPYDIGEPIPKMMERVKNWLSEGIQVKIFTARASVPSQIPPVKKWLEKHGLGSLPITCQKDIDMEELWDDRVVQVIPNTGEPVKKGISKYEKDSV
jgi:hydroxymethylpyrimidine pyrophosphatase-like HAD family hydrolase